MPDLPPILYKYCDLKGLDILANLRLKVTPFNEFNDPFELAPRMNLDDAKEVVRSSILKDEELLHLTYRQMQVSGQFVGNYDQFVKFIAEHTDRLIRDLAEPFPARVAEFRRNHVKDISRAFGLICYSALRDVILMWSHYTRGHTGLVIGFNTDALLFSEGAPAQQVEYLEERAVLDYPPKSRDPQLRAQIIALIRRKSPEWKYEAEWRQLYPLSNCVLEREATPPHKPNYFFPIDTASISEVILGCRCTDKRAHRILQQKHFQHVRLLRAAPDDELFQLQIIASKQAQSITHAAQDEVLREQSEQTMLYMSAASLKASYEAAQMDGKQLLVRDTAQALEAHNRNADRTHGWSAARQQGSMVAVQVNVPMPTQAERDEMRRLDDKLDAFAAMLKEKAAERRG